MESNHKGQLGIDFLYKDKLPSVIVYTDGSCTRNPGGAGGWAAIIYKKEEKKEIYGGINETTSNRMELTAAIKALEYLEEPSDVKLFSDSAYLVNSISLKWILGWERKNWKASTTKPVKNPDLWRWLLELCRKHYVIMVHIRGHTGNLNNERCDELARGCSIFYELENLKI